MQRTHGAAILGIATAAAVTAALVAPIGSATADPSAPNRPAQAKTAPGSDVRTVGPNYNDGKALPATGELKTAVKKGPANRGAQQRAPHDPSVGETRSWLANNDVSGSIYRKDYVLRGLGNHIQVWVAKDTTFPAGDCRNDLGLTDITDAQVNGFVDQFDNNIYPKESASFSVPPSLSGTNNLINGPDGSADYYEVSAAQADDIVVLVDNVRDANYYDPSTPDGQTYIAGFFYSTFNDYTDRNIMTIDAYDWLHRTGATPPDDSADPAYQACAAASGKPNPRLYEGTFAHEYQHLLEHYEDADEASWVNEGLSDYAQTLVGYVDTSLPPTDKDADSHIGCFQGFLPESYGGAENSLTRWGDQGGPEILCDYGAAYSFMMYLSSHYGEDFMSTLHREDANGIKGLNKVLKQFDATKNAKQTLHDWLATMALDSAIDESGTVKGGSKKWLTASQLNSEINWSNPQSYNSEGAPTNGADYVRLGSVDHWLKAKKIKRISFNGAESYTPSKVQWTVDSTPPAATTADTTCGAVEDGTGAAALYSGCGENLDRSIVRAVTVPAGGGTLSFETLFDAEETWDYGFVQVSTDGGKSWTSLATEDTTSEPDPAADPGVVANLPGFTGDSGGWLTEHADLAKYAGKKILVGFRYITDGAVNEGGFFVRNIDVAGTKLPSDSIAGWQTITQVSPVPVNDWTVQILAIGANGKSWIHQLELNKENRGWIQGKALRKAIGSSASTVAVLVTPYDPTEAVTQYGRYHLKVAAPQGAGNRG
ncbi:immune inhibitor A [Nocardioides sp. KIGAM211]|uniref:Immune inhibitor A n=1 Tax=Nocardioides luti TaxID=2761101 RepID=A0A7X0RIK5_9ACTN|nr:immune inhibitor A domain-containing protein [Nocardioides luti]MBB6628942.1 immune inhibitor A [Nocardioides luti]